ncbi:glycosyltransferase family 92 protein C33H5.2-like [Dendrobates tinctorius]|uniref:glycosyltransferase family 92 protein C33H5.2-like n=1 Tax=Dendrobates tinctorius TaxID=92724 RepID=UPI003CCA209B
MSCSLKQKFIACNVLVLFFILLFYLLQPQDAQISYISNIAIGPLIPLQDNKTLIIAPYYDPRESSLIRILAIVHHTVNNFFCLFYCKQFGYVHVMAEIDIVQDNFGFPYETASLLCRIPPDCDFNYISVYPNRTKDISQIPVFEISKDPMGPFSANFTVCISALYGKYDYALQMIQAIEMYKLLGASRVTIYNTSCGDNVDKVMRHYIQEGVLEVIPWPIDKYLKTSKKWEYVKGLDSEIGYYGQIASLNDCMYRNMFKSEYVLLNDIDEIIIPLQYWDWPTLMSNLQKRYPHINVFRFENQIYLFSEEASGSKLWNQIPGDNILQRLYREPINNMTRTVPKMIINPRNVIYTSIHSVIKAKGQVALFVRRDAIVFHCKNSRNKNILENDWIKDDLILRYNTSLVPKVNYVVQKIFPKN